MRNQEAARYARMAAMAAGVIVLFVAGIYAQRAVRTARARKAASPSVPSGVQQQSANFTYSDVEQGRTVFTLRASHATQFKNQNRALLDDVWITVYGRAGDRNDNIHTRRCSYEPDSGGVRCQGEVQIDIQGAKDASGTPAANLIEQPLLVKTSDLVFNRQTGEASTGAPVEFSFPQGKGRGVGVRYSTRESAVRIEHAVEFDLNPSEHSGGLPVKATGSSLEVQRNERLVVLVGPAAVQQGGRELSAGKISITFDKENHAQSAVAEEHPSIQGKGNDGKFRLSAEKIQVSLAPEGWLTGLVADDSVVAMRERADGRDRLLAQHAEMGMIPGGNLVREMTITGGVSAESQEGADSRTLKTESLVINFKAENRRRKGRPAGTTTDAAGAQQIESAETLAPATIESKAGNDTTRLNAKKFVAQFGEGGRLERLLGHDDVELGRQVGGGALQTSSAGELVATFAASGEWESIEETGHVRLIEADRRANANSAKMQRSTGMVTLEGSPVISDSQSRTVAGAVTLNQQSGEIHATGGVVSTYLRAPSSGNDTLSIGAGPAQLSADKLDGSGTVGHVTYSGHARLWQGKSVLEAEQIEIWRDEKKMEARGHIVAIFQQAPGTGPAFGIGATKTSATRVPAGESGDTGGSKATLWQIRSPSLTYWSDQERMHLDGGVVASSDQGSLESRSLDVFLAPSGAKVTGPNKKQMPAGEAGGREVSRLLAQGGVLVRQQERRATAEQAEYTAAEQKFVLSGGQPTINDAASDTTTEGRSLTFFVASDTILIDSQEGLRTLTKHRVEK